MFASTAVAAERTAIVHNPDSTDRLNLRTEPNEDSPTLGKYYNGVNVEVLSDVSNGRVKVRFYNLEGYMKADFLEYGLDQVPIASAMPSVKIKNTGSTGLNLRKTQSMDSSSLGLYKNGSTVLVYGVNESWCHVETSDGKVGFMLRDQLSSLLEFQKSGSASGNGTSNNANDVWLGPVGSHQVAEWTLTLNDYLAVVNNPNSAERLHLRVGPNEDADSLGKYYNGVRVYIDGQPEGDWLPVSVGNLSGYMKTQRLVISGEGQPYPDSEMPILLVNNPNKAGKFAFA